jgi:hypothetical protein
MGSKGKTRRRQRSRARKATAKKEAPVQPNGDDKETVTEAIKQWPLELTEISEAEWRKMEPPPPVNLFKIMQSRYYHVQFYAVRDNLVQMNVVRIRFNKLDDKDNDNIPWDVMQNLKAQAGLKDKCAVELYPPFGFEINPGNNPAGASRVMFIYMDSCPYFMAGFKVWQEEMADRERDEAPSIIVPQASSARKAEPVIENPAGGNDEDDMR